MKIFTACILALCLVVIALGAYTRLKDAGLGCPDWPLCYGRVLVPERMAIPHLDGGSFDSSKAWIEVVHRFVAALLGLAVLGLLFLDIRAVLRRNRRGGRRISRLLMLLCLLVVVQALFGMWTVTLRLLPQVVTIHLLGGMAVLALVFIHLLNQTNFSTVTLAPVPGFLLFFTYLGLGLLIGQIALGGWVSSNYAALACPDFPLCHGAWLPPADFAQGFNFLQPPGPNYEGGVLDAAGRTAIHLAHRYAAWLLLLYWGGYYCYLRKRLPRFSSAVDLIGVLLLAQIALGITNVLADLPLMIAVAHNLGAAVLLLAVIALLYRLHYANKPIRTAF